MNKLCNFLDCPVTFNIEDRRDSVNLLPYFSKSTAYDKDYTPKKKDNKNIC